MIAIVLCAMSNNICYIVLLLKTLPPKYHSMLTIQRFVLAYVCVRICMHVCRPAPIMPA